MTEFGTHKFIDKINGDEEWRKYLQQLIHFFVTNDEKILKESLETNDIVYFYLSLYKSFHLF